MVECPEFRALCMVLWESLTESNIPYHNKLGEAIIHQWWELFEGIKLKLSVS